MRIRTLVTGATLAVVAASVTASSAAAQTFFGTDATGSSAVRSGRTNSDAANALFLAALVGVGTEDFEGFAAGTSSPLGIVFAGAGTATLFGSALADDIVVTGAGLTNGVGRYPSSGTHWYESAAADGAFTTNMSIVFSDPVAAFGFYGMDLGDFASQVTLHFHLTGGGFDDFTLPYTTSSGTNSARDGSILFAGYINTITFTQVDFNASPGVSGGDFFGFDDMTIGSLQQVVSATPEPGTWALMATGLFGFAGVARRRRKA